MEGAPTVLTAPVVGGPERLSPGGPSASRLLADGERAAIASGSTVLVCGIPGEHGAEGEAARVKSGPLTRCEGVTAVALPGEASGEIQALAGSLGIAQRRA